MKLGVSRAKPWLSLATLVCACAGHSSSPSAGSGGAQAATPQPSAQGANPATASSSVSPGSGAAGTGATSAAPAAMMKAGPAAPPGMLGNAGASAAAPATGGGAGSMSAPAKQRPVLYWLDITSNAVYRANADGSDAHAIATGNGISAPDGVSVDVEGGHLYWTNMGSALGGANLGTVERASLDGTAIETIVPTGVGNTFKQMTIDRVHHKLYFCDREGAKVWRANLDGSQHEVLASGHGFNQLVGIALDVPRAQFYFTDRNARKILRAGFDMPAGQTDADRTDIEELIALGSTAMPIDLDLDLDHRLLYFTDRALGTVNRLPMDLPAGQTASNRSDLAVLVSGLSQPIGITLDMQTSSIYFGDLSGQLYRADLDGKNRASVAHSVSITGVTLAYVPSP